MNSSIGGYYTSTSTTTDDYRTISETYDFIYKYMNIDNEYIKDHQWHQITPKPVPLGHIDNPRILILIRLLKRFDDVDG